MPAIVAGCNIILFVCRQKQTRRLSGQAIGQQEPCLALRKLPQKSPRKALFLHRLYAFDASVSAQQERPMSILTPDYSAMLSVAIAEARQGLAEGGIPIGAALFHNDGRLLGSGHNRRVQEGDPSVHGETDAFRKAGRQRSYRDTIMVTTLEPCWYCSGLVRQFGIGTVVIGESDNFTGGAAWLRDNGVNVVQLHNTECISMLGDYIAANPHVWHEDIGED